jgi:glycosyltransferase involved in cell wall biosynthesis
MRILVVTVVHTPLDARIHHRQIRALSAAGVRVTYAAPWSSTGTPPGAAVPGIRTIDLPRATGRRRLRALRAARRCIRSQGQAHDLLLLHDPELLLAVAGQLSNLPPVVLDVHEDTAAALVDRAWLPPAARRVTSWAVRRTERWAERHLHLLLAERSYQERFARPHPFVPNVPPRPEQLPPQPGEERVVFLGRIAHSRGAREMLSVATTLQGEFRFELIGPVDADIEPLLETAVAAGHVHWTGFTPNDEALQRIDGALAGLSLIHPQPNHAGSLQTKVLEYLSRRVPVISTDLPVTGAFIRDHRVGITVPTDDPDATVRALRRLRDDPDGRRAMADRGFALICDELNWDRAGRIFVDHLRAVAASGGSTRPS